MSEPIFNTIHGSRLYGLSHANSDTDVFVVTTSNRTKAHQSIGPDGDICEVPWQVFLERIYEGSHQSVEALFSPYKVWSDKYLFMRDYAENYRVTGSNVFAKYERTIKKFAFGDFKRRRHAARLSMNLTGLRREGRFNPVMTEEQRWWATAVAERFEGEDLLELVYG